MEQTDSTFSPGMARRRYFLGRGFHLAVIISCLCLPASAALQFDVFLGYDSIVPEACWFPVICEIKNDGPSFNASVEVSAGNFGEGPTRRLPIELPTGTLKRVVIPVFSSARGVRGWDVTLRDGRGRVRAEQTGVNARSQPAAGTVVLGALPRTPAGAPVLRQNTQSQADLQPAVARLLPAIFPDNPLVLEGLTAIYLNSERAADLSVPQTEALLAWLYAGGHLIVGLEQPGDIPASPWLNDIFPMRVENLVPVRSHPEFQDWLTADYWPGEQQAGEKASVERKPRARSTGTSSRLALLEKDSTFETTPVQVGVGQLGDARVVLQSGDLPLVVEANRGRGNITVLLFSPEREPFRSWTHLPVFWARVSGVPASYYTSANPNRWGGWSSDGILGAMLDSRQVHKLPLPWLLALLCVYLVVIGPFDYFWLKRMRRQMLTWITFPCYVIGFSAIIYLIGYKLRAGDSELNQLHIVDVFPRGGQAQLRGRTFTSIYAPANERHTLSGGQQYAAFRGEFETSWGRSQGEERHVIIQAGNGYQARVSVPVWTSSLFVADWWEPSSLPVRVRATKDAAGWHGTIENRTAKALTQVRFVTEDGIATIEDVPAGATKEFRCSQPPPLSRSAFLSPRISRFQNAIQGRQYAFGRESASRIDDLPESALGVSLLGSAVTGTDPSQVFVVPPGLDTSPVLKRGIPMVFAWSDGAPTTKPMLDYSPARTRVFTFWRCTAQTK